MIESMELNKQIFEEVNKFRGFYREIKNNKCNY